MATKNHSHVVLFLFLPILFGACDKWNESPKFESNTLLLKIENADNKVIANYEYDRNNNLKSSWHKRHLYYSEEKAEFSYEYDSNGLLIKKQGYEPGNPVMSSLTGAMGKDVTVIFTYDSNERVINMKAKYEFDGFSEINYSMNYNYEYPNDSIIIERITNINELANSTTNHNEYQFNSDGNLVKIRSYIASNLNDERTLSIEEYKYDNKKSPIRFEAIRQSKNNVTEKIMTVYNYDEKNTQSVAYQSTYKYQFTYNENGFPESKTETWPNDQLFIEYYFYKK